jgi:predicted aldo/keto reductase-like oxidoreductase
MPDHIEKTAKLSRPSRRSLLKGLGAVVAGGAAYHALDSLKLLPGEASGLPEPSGEEMTYRINPRNGDHVSLLGYGCMRFPMLSGAASPTGPEVDEQAAMHSVDYAYRHGVNYFDTAWPYHRGVSEVVTGKALKRYPRSTFYVADKMPGFLNPDKKQAEEYFNIQLERCQIDYFDYYLLHSLISVDNYRHVYEENGVLDYLLQQKASGRIRNLGWSFHGDREMLDYLLSRDADWDFVMLQLNYHDLLHEYKPVPALQSRLTRAAAQPRWVLERLSATGLPVIIMEPLLGGRLARLSKKALAVLQEERPEASAASWAFRYAASLPNVLTILSGMTHLEHLQDNLRTYSPFEPLSGQELAVLRRGLDLFVTQENIPCTACGYCLPCPYDVNIPAVFTHYNYCLDDEYIPKGARDAEYESARRAYLIGYDRSIPDLRQASHCTGCNLCLEHCPQNIAIPEQMARLSRFVEELRTGA